MGRWLWGVNFRDGVQSKLWTPISGIAYLLGYTQIKTGVQNVLWTPETTLAGGLTGIFTGGWRFKGQPDSKGAALAYLAGHFDAAAVRFHQPIGNGET